MEFYFSKIGTSSVVYPAAGYASMISQRNIPIVEINIETTPSTSLAKFIEKDLFIENLFV